MAPEALTEVTVTATALSQGAPGPATSSSADFKVFRVDGLVDNSTTDFDLFINLENHFILYSGNGYRWQRAELTELLRVGHDHFYIRTQDLPKAQMYDSIAKLPLVEKLQPPPERIQTIEQVGARFVQCLYAGELTETCVRKAESIAGSMVDCVGEDPSCIKFLSGLADHDYYTYYHSIRVATYAVGIALGMGLKDEAALRAIALGGIFHDVGKKDVPLSVLNKSGPLSDSEWALMKSHPLRGFQVVEQTLLQHVPREIIVHHHERLNGSGYPHGLDRNSLLPEVQVATLADVFDALTSSRTYQAKRSKYEALDFIKHRLLKAEVSSDAYKALVLTLAK